MKSEHHGTSARKGDYLIYIPPADDDEDYGKIARRETPATDAGANTYYGFYVPAAEDDEDYGNDVQNAQTAVQGNFGLYVRPARANMAYQEISHQC